MSYLQSFDTMANSPSSSEETSAFETGDNLEENATQNSQISSVEEQQPRAASRKEKEKGESNEMIFKTPVEGAKTKVTPHEMQQQIFMKSCTDALKNCDEESESTAFGKFVATKHRKLNESQRMYAETLITKILHKAALNQLTEDTSIFDLQSQNRNTFSSPSLLSSITSSPAPSPGTSGAAAKCRTVGVRFFNVF
ncbi:uncharacterized protein LOC126736879 [Anthonomus grandis grandis]|uniref:uncharacterized protein LOC126736879 n=1 Tax=Anthonomus grandis grandis TaxID=2921223 RepID=UPI0021660CB0|nr:uncharacterized protein LOC126736879 [Anthonomus grandis grandis]